MMERTRGERERERGNFDESFYGELKSQTL